MRMMPCTMPSASVFAHGVGVRLSGVAHLVGAQRTVQNNGYVKSEPKYLACEESPMHAFYF